MQESESRRARERVTIKSGEREMKKISQRK